MFASDSVAVLPVADTSMPTSRVVLGVDLVGSSALPNDRLDRATHELERCLHEAMDLADLPLDESDHVRGSGDGVLLSLPESRADRAVELVFHLDHVLRLRNRDRRVPLRARLAVHCAPMRADGRYHRPYIEVTRLLAAPAFQSAVAYCARRDPNGDKLGAALIVSRWMWRNVVEPFRAPLAPPARCAPIRVSPASCHDDAWIHLPGTDVELVLEHMPRGGGAEESELNNRTP